jgi:hypothetical protein
MVHFSVAEQLKAPKYADKIARDDLLRLKRVSSRFKSEIPASCVPAELAAAGWEAYTASDGRPYFVDHNTGQTHWELPAAAWQGGSWGRWCWMHTPPRRPLQPWLHATPRRPMQPWMHASPRRPMQPWMHASPRRSRQLEAALAARDADEENRAQLKAAKVAAKNVAKKAWRVAQAAAAAPPPDTTLELDEPLARAQGALLDNPRCWTPRWSSTSRRQGRKALTSNRS